MSIYKFVIALMFAIVGAASSQAAIVLEYTGLPLEFADSPFTGTDSITGLVTFSGVGATSAQSAILSVSIGGAPGYTLVDNSGSIGSFGSWVGSVPTTWNLDLFGNVFGGPANEQLGISSSLGDTAVVDLDAAGSFAAINFDRGAFSVVTVPEPTSIVLVAGLAGAFIARRRRR